MPWPGNLDQVALSRPLVELAARQGGYIKRIQLLESGLSASGVDRRIRSGSLIPVSEATYQLFPSTDHVDLMRGALLALPNAVVSHQSAAHVLDFPRLPKLVATVTVASHTTHKFPGVIVRRSDDLDRSHVTKAQGLRVTTVARTAFDLGGILEFEEFDSLVEAVILDGRMKLRHLEALTDALARKGKPGSRAAKDFIAVRLGSDPKSTALERRGRALLASAGLAPPRAQHRIPWDPRRRFDDAYPEARLAIEWDSRAWHSQRAAMAADRRRDREAALHGWSVIRFTWEEIADDPHQVVSTVASLLRERLLTST